MSSPSPNTTPNGESLREKWISRFLKHPVWLGIGGVIGALILAVSLLAWLAPSSGDGKPAPSAPAINGDCNAQGTNNRVNCVNPSPP